MVEQSDTIIFAQGSMGIAALHPSYELMVGTLRFVHPTKLRTDLLRAQAQFQHAPANHF
jgi:hypothetical protein